MTSRLGDDAHYVDSTARLFGWVVEVDSRSGGRLRLRRGQWAAEVRFSPSGGFVRSLVHGPAREARELGLAELVRLLERQGSTVRPSA